MINSNIIEWYPLNYISINNKYYFQYTLLQKDDNRIVMNIPHFSELDPQEEEDAVHDICDSLIYNLKRATNINYHAEYMYYYDLGCWQLKIVKF